MKIAPLPLLATCLLLCIAHPSPVDAQQFGAFGQRPNRDIVVPVFADDDIARALSTLDVRLAEAGNRDGRAGPAERIYFDLSRYLQTGLLTPGAADARAGALRPHRSLAAGRGVAAGAAAWNRHEILARKDGAGHRGHRPRRVSPLKLSEHRGKVVVLMFGGEWCGICKTEYPYLRLLTEVYGNWPFVILGVNSDPSPALARQASKERGLPYRVWWDGQGGRSTDGPIARDWRIVGGRPLLRARCRWRDPLRGSASGRSGARRQTSS